MTTRTKVLLGTGAFIGAAVLLFAIFGPGERTDFQPQSEFELKPWVMIEVAGIDLSISKGVLYLFLAAGLTIGAMLYIANRMQARPNRVQTAVETAYTFMRNDIARDNMDDAMARRWFPFIGALFLFIWISNMIGYIPLPINTEHPVDVLGLAIPAFAIYAATANISVTLVLTLVVWIAYHVEGVRAKGLKRYLASWIPGGTPKAMRPVLFGIEAISQFVRIISLSVRLFANILAGHLLILFMAGGLAVILGLAALGAITLPVAWVFFLFEVVLIATLQAFIFATLSSIYLGEAVAESH